MKTYYMAHGETSIRKFATFCCEHASNLLFICKKNPVMDQDSAHAGDSEILSNHYILLTFS
jgi:hypothetical protein